MIILTIDTDWAPDHATIDVLERVRALGVKATVFFSTPNPVGYWPLLEAGCHPDLSRRVADNISPSGRPHEALALADKEHDNAVEKAEEEILNGYRHSFPSAEAVRTHRFYWHSDLSRLMAKTGFKHDSSLILPFHPNLKGFRVGRLTRWPVWSSDHLHLARRLPLDRLAMPSWSEPGLKIFCFHVAYLYLNSADLGDFNMIKEGLSAEDSLPARDARPGVWNLFEALAAEIKKESQGCWLSEIPESQIVQSAY